MRISIHFLQAVRKICDEMGFSHIYIYKVWRNRLAGGKTTTSTRREQVGAGRKKKRPLMGREGGVCE